MQTFPSCFTNGHRLECAFGLGTVASLSLLIVEESLLVATFKLRYFKRFDVWVKWAVYAGTVGGFFFQSNLEVTRRTFQ